MTASGQLHAMVTLFIGKNPSTHWIGLASRATLDALETSNPRLSDTQGVTIQHY
jgi:hypothetical protein